MIGFIAVALLFGLAIAAPFALSFYLSWKQADAFNYADFDDTGDSL